MRKITALALATLLSFCLTTPCFSDGPNEGPKDDSKVYTQIDTDRR